MTTTSLKFNSNIYELQKRGMTMAHPYGIIVDTETGFIMVTPFGIEDLEFIANHHKTSVESIVVDKGEPSKPIKEYLGHLTTLYMEQIELRKEYNKCIEDETISETSIHDIDTKYRNNHMQINKLTENILLVQDDYINHINLKSALREDLNRKDIDVLYGYMKFEIRLLTCGVDKLNVPVGYESSNSNALIKYDYEEVLNEDNDHLDICLKSVITIDLVNTLTLNFDEDYPYILNEIKHITGQ